MKNFGQIVVAVLALACQGGCIVTLLIAGGWALIRFGPPIWRRWLRPWWRKVATWWRPVYTRAVIAVITLFSVLCSGCLGLITLMGGARSNGDQIHPAFGLLFCAGAIVLAPLGILAWIRTRGTDNDADEPDDFDEDLSPEEIETAVHALRGISGIGPTYARWFVDQGVEDIEGLALFLENHPDEVTRRFGKHAETWLAEARKKLVQEDDEDVIA